MSQYCLQGGVVVLVAVVCSFDMDGECDRIKSTHAMKTRGGVVTLALLFPIRRRIKEKKKNGVVLFITPGDVP